MATVAVCIWEHKFYTGNRDPRSLMINRGLTALLWIVELLNPGTCVFYLCFLFPQVLLRLGSIFFFRCMPSWILIKPPESPVQFSLQLLPLFWEDFTFQNVLKSTFPTSTLTVLTELPSQALEAPRTQGQCIALLQCSQVTFCFQNVTFNISWNINPFSSIDKPVFLATDAGK